MVTHGLGLTDGDWSDVERAEYAKAVDMFGPTGADYMMHGVSRHLFGVDLHHRLGLNSFFTFGMPDKLTKESVTSFLFNQALGAPAGLAEDTFSGINQMMNGDVVNGAAKAFPSQALRDVMKVWNGGSKNYQYSPTEDVGRLMGFTPAGEAERGERVSNMIQERGEFTNERSGLMKAWLQGGNKAQAWADIQKFNAQQQDPAARITMAQLQRALASGKTANEHGMNYMGMRFNRTNQFIAKQDQRLYGP
jgi:hypothetical protein